MSPPLCPRSERPDLPIPHCAHPVDTLLRYREEFGISYIGVLEDHMKTFAEVIPLLR
jgi:hypothetical protein